MTTKKLSSEPAGTSQVCVRMAADLIARVDAYRDTLQAGMPPSLAVSRADAVRALVTLGLEQAEKKQRKK